MFNFIICDDNIQFLKNVEKIINKVMFNQKTDYKIHSFENYNEYFNKLILNNLPNKIYILDIETKTISGFDIIRKIRKTDRESKIIVLTSHDELIYHLIGEDLEVFNFISKYKNYENILINSIINILNTKISDIFIFKNNKLELYLNMKEINYIKYDKETRNVIMKTLDNNFKIPITLKNIFDLLNENFIYSHRACIINKNNIKKVDFDQKNIIFNNGDQIDLLSNMYYENIINN